MRHPMIRLTLLFGVLLSPLSLLGCSGSQNTTGVPKGEQAAMKAGQEDTLNRQLKEIDDNPNMPPQAKEAAKATIRQGQQVDQSARK